MIKRRVVFLFLGLSFGFNFGLCGTPFSNTASAVEEPASNPGGKLENETLLKSLAAKLRSESYDEREAAQAALLAVSVENAPVLKRILAAETDQEARTRLSRVIARISRPFWSTDLSAALKAARDADRPVLVFSTIGEVNGFS